MNESYRTLDTEKPLIHKKTGEEIERNRTGSLFVEIDLSTDEGIQKIGRYYVDLLSRHDVWLKEQAPYQASELLPGQTQFEVALLETLVRQRGRVNLWDASVELMREDGSISDNFTTGCERLISGLETEAQIQE